MDDFDEGTMTPHLEGAIDPASLGYREIDATFTAMPMIYFRRPTVTRTMPATHEARCKELASMTEWRFPDGAEPGVEYDMLPSPDPRFASLRGEHRFDDGAGHCYACTSDALLGVKIAIEVQTFENLDTVAARAGGQSQWSSAPTAAEAISAALWRLVFGG